MFYDNLELLRHSKMHQKLEPTLPVCPDYNGSFANAAGLKCHLPKCQGPFVCRICKESRSSRSNLEQHYQVCKTKLECPICHLRFLNKQDLEKHAQKEHAKQKTYACQSCPSVFYTEEALFGHLAKDHKDLFPSSPK